MRHFKTDFHTIKWQVKQELSITFEQAIEISVKTLLELITPKVSGFDSMYDHYYFMKDGQGDYRLYMHEDARGRGSDTQKIIRFATQEETKVLKVVEMLNGKT